MSTHRSTWKRRERNAASLFGAQRQVLSGSSGRGERSRSDSTHERLYIEAKTRASSAVRRLWENTKKLAHREHKVAVVMLFDKHKPGALIVVHQDDLAAVASELAKDRQAAQGTYPAREDEVEPQVDRPIVPGQRPPRKRTP
jgi:hypothetical protein